MTEPMEGLIDTDTALDREVDILSEKFPDVSRDDLEREVRDAYAELEKQAHVSAHLVALTRASVMDRLRERGLHPVHEFDA
jgi:hypothetical protein